MTITWPLVYLQNRWEWMRPESRAGRIRWWEEDVPGTRKGIRLVLLTIIAIFKPFSCGLSKFANVCEFHFRNLSKRPFILPRIPCGFVGVSKPVSSVCFQRCLEQEGLFRLHVGRVQKAPTFIGNMPANMIIEHCVLNDRRQENDINKHNSRIIAFMS